MTRSKLPPPQPDESNRKALRIGVLLSGMGRDGALGMAAIHEAGGVTIAQDEETSIVYGMPKAAIALGVIDHIESLEGISSRILSCLEVANG